MRRASIVFAAALAVMIAPAVCRSDDGCVRARRQLSEFPEATAELLSAFDTERSAFENRGLGASYCAELLANFAAKRDAQGAGAHMTAERMLRQGIQYESFRLNTYLNAGVSPKRYFGFFDEEGDTAEFETILRRTIIDAVAIIRAYTKEFGPDLPISEREIALTYLAEGGALILTEPEDSTDRIHPVRGVGLDNFRLGFKRFSGLVARFDDHFGTRLDSLLIQIGNGSILLRPMTFRESVLGTALMYLREKEIATRLMREEWGVEMGFLALPQQFISTSLVYNSGLLFAQERTGQISQFSTGEYLAKVNLESRRPKLEVYPPNEALQRLTNGERIPRQLTSWSAVYHILQRYGAWVAVERFSDVFNGGEFSRR